MKKGVPVLLAVLVALTFSLFPWATQGSWLTISTSAAINIADTSATLNGCVTVPQGLQNPFTLEVYFVYGTQPGALSNTTSVQQVEILINHPSTCYSQTITGLSPCTPYYAQAVGFVASSKKPSANSFFLAALINPKMWGAGIGVDPAKMQETLLNGNPQDTLYGSVISFTTTGCTTFIGTGPTSHGTGGVGFGGTTTTPTTNLSNIVVQSAAISSTKVSPGDKADVTAYVTNKGNSNGTSKVTLYINGQIAESKGITLTSGESTQVHFSVSQNEPGTYSVYVNGVPAGNLTVNMFTNNDVLIYGIIALFTIGIIGVLYLVVRKRTT